MTPLISIIIPTFNASETLTDCLESLKNQVYQNFEIIQVDGVSTDTTLNISKEYKNSFENFLIISELDAGIYDAMNKGIRLAKGKWLYFLGSDDTLIDENVLDKISKEIVENHQISVIYGNVNSVFYGGKYDGEFTYDKLSRLNICHQAIFFNKKVFKKTGLFNLKYKVVSDWDHNIKWFFNDKIKQKYVDLTIANFTDGGISASNIDSLFEKEKNFNLLKVGFNKLSFFELRRLCTVELEKLTENMNIFKLLYLNTYLFVIRGRRKRNHIIKRQFK